MADSHGMYTHTSECGGEESSGSGSQTGDGRGVPVVISPPPGTSLGLVLGGVSGGNFSSPPFALLLPRWGFGVCQHPTHHGTALAQAVRVSDPAGCPPCY